MEMVTKREQGWLYLYQTKIDFKIKTITRDKELHKYEMEIQQEDIKIIKIHAPNIGAPKYINQVLRELKEEINSITN